jgi:diguanylate cyclase (GGDEF)-like protein
VSPRDSEQTRVTQLSEVEAPEPPGNASVIVIYGSELGKRLQLGTAPFSIGRSASNDLSLDEESVSRNHVRVTFDGTHHWLVDLKSTNGTFINDHPVTEHRLVDGDQIRVGRSILKFMTGKNLEAQYHEEIYRLMTVDGLTQVHNRRYFNEALEREFNRARRYERALSLIVLDLDHFKRVNDTFGHLAGDNLLRHVAMALKPKLRNGDILARTGGEEFAALLPEIDVEGARITAEKLRRIVETTELRQDEQALSCTVSVGVAGLGSEHADPEALYKAADERMYEAKHAGRNRVVG